MIDLLLGVLCEVRGPAHYEQHGGLKADSAWHVAHGERPTCDSNKTSSSGGGWDWGRDDFGYHCTWRGCG